MMKKRVLILGMVAALGMSGCAMISPEPGEVTDPRVPVESDLPDWVASPTIEGGIASTECVPWTGNMTIDKAEATALARKDLAMQIETNVRAMDETYQRATRTNAGASTGQSFESVSNQLADQTLVGAKAIHNDLIPIVGEQHWCTMVAMDPEASRELFDKILSKSGREISAKDEDVLYNEFRAHKKQQELEQKIMQRKGD